MEAESVFKIYNQQATWPGEPVMQIPVGSKDPRTKRVHGIISNLSEEN